MQSKPVSYHKGKRSFFVRLFCNSKNVSVNTPSDCFLRICEPAAVRARGPAMMHVCASALESCTFALRAINIAQEMHLQGWADCQVKSDVKVANKEKKKCHSLLVYDVTYRAICCVIMATGEGS